MSLDGVRADPSVIASVRLRLAEFAHRIGLSDDTTHNVLLATYEALANVVEHAYPAGEPGTFDLRADHHQDDGRFTVIIVDRGTWRPESDNRDAYRGRGLRLMQACSDAVRVERCDGGTQIQLQWTNAANRTSLPDREQ